MVNKLTCPECKATVVQYRNPFPTVDIIIRKGDSIVLIERKNEPLGWALPGGFVDYGESLETAAARELQEETGLTVTSIRQFRAYSDPSRDPRQHNISVVFIAEATGTLQGGDDAAQARLFPINALPENLCFDHATIINDYLRETGERTTPAVSFVAKSGSGKTTLLEKVIPLLKERGYRVGVIKHDAHSFDIDHPGKDSYRLYAAGADTAMITSPAKRAMTKREGDGTVPVTEAIAAHFGDVDLVITEGFKRSGLPKIEVNRLERSAGLICRGEENDPTLIAVASDQQLALDVPLLDLNNAVQIVDFLEERFLKR